MSNEVLVSIIIPIYNVDQYLPRCIDSVIAQTYHNLEIILVNDGSTDNSLAICNNYKRIDNRVAIINKKNGGLASARNTGMKVVKGEYILFVDSDDWIEPQTIKELLEIALSYDVDFVRFTPVTANHPTLCDGTPVNFGTEDLMENGIYDKDKIKRILYPNLFCTSDLKMGPIVAAWRSLYKTEFLIDNELYFDEDVKYSEDSIFSAKVVYQSNRFYYLKGGYYYHYFYNNQSITKSFKKDRWEVCKILAQKFREEFQIKKDYDFSSQIHLEHIFNIMNALGQSNCLNFIDRYKYVKGIFNDKFTIDAIKHHKLVKKSWKLKIIIFLIKYRLVFLYCIIVR